MSVEIGSEDDWLIGDPQPHSVSVMCDHLAVALSLPKGSDLVKQLFLEELIRAPLGTHRAYTRYRRASDDGSFVHFRAQAAHELFLEVCCSLPLPLFPHFPCPKDMHLPPSALAMDRE